MKHVKSLIALPCGALVTSFYVLWQLIVEQKLFLQTFFIERMGKRGIRKLPLGYNNIFQLKCIMLWQQFTGNTRSLDKRKKRIYQNILEKLELTNVKKNQIIAIKEYQAGEIDSVTFYKNHVKKGVPCIIRGFEKTNLDRWNLASLSYKFPDVIAQVLDRQNKKIKSVTVNEVFEDNKTKYIPQQALLNQNQELLDYFDVDHSEKFFPVFGKHTKPVACYLIIGLGKGLNANYHCEESPNWYKAVSGTKQWTLVEAEYSWLLYPAARGTGMRRFSEFLADENGDPRDRGNFPLFDYAPRYEFLLHAGDILFFPAWMWHKTINLNHEGLGVTSRHTAPTVMSNRYFRALQMLSPDFWKKSTQVIGGMIRGDSAGLEDSGDYNEQEIPLY